MKKIITLLMAVLMPVSLIGCGSSTEPAAAASAQPEASAETQPETAAETPAPEEEIEDEGWDKLESLGNVKTENGIFYVYVTVPAELAGSDITQESIDAKAGETYTSGKINDDGSVTYKMTKKQHKAMMEGIRESFDSNFAEITASADNAITKIEHNDNYTKFDITLSTNEVGLGESFMALAFYVCGGMYGIFSGEQPKEVIVNYYAPDGTLISSGSSANAGN